MRKEYAMARILKATLGTLLVAGLLAILPASAATLKPTPTVVSPSPSVRVSLLNKKHHARPKSVGSGFDQYIDYQVHLAHDFVNGSLATNLEFAQTLVQPMDKNGGLYQSVETVEFFSGYLGIDPASDYVEFGADAWNDPNGTSHSSWYVFTNNGSIVCDQGAVLFTNNYRGCTGQADSMNLLTPNGFGMGAQQVLAKSPFFVYFNDVAVAHFPNLTTPAWWGPKLTTEVAWDSAVYPSDNPPVTQFFDEHIAPSYAQKVGGQLQVWFPTDPLCLECTANYSDTDFVNEQGSDQCNGLAGGNEFFIHGPHSWNGPNWIVAAFDTIYPYNVGALQDANCGQAPMW
jgi:hypothetical protein